MDQPPTILVIDDSPDALEGLRSLFEQNGYRVAVALDGPQGLALAREQKPDCIILDIKMPEMSGFHVCQSLKSDPACEQIPIVVLTALKQDRDRSYARTVGADDFLGKPVRPSQLLAVVKQHLAGKPSTVRRLGLRHILLISEDQGLTRGLAAAVEAYNFLHKSEDHFGLADAPTLADARRAIGQNQPAAIVVDAKAQNEAADQIVRRLKGDLHTKAFPLLVIRHGRSDDLKFAWAQARLPGQPSGKDIVAAVAGLLGQ
jgi:DNA-binding response OmpR family regulator